jgi:NAD(P)-dependent dehydrogenase (short-subunit alcohol dehydrogenase family)
MTSINSSASIAGKTYVVVGAAGNLGPTWCEVILASGGEVIALGLNVTSDSRLKELHNKYTGKFEIIENDICVPLRDEVVDLLHSKRIAGLVLNAGIDSLPGSGFSNITEFDYKNWVEILSVNVAAIATVTNSLIPFLSVDASVVFIGSIYAVVSPSTSLYSHFNSGLGSIKNPAYGASKAALIALCNQYATHFAPTGQRFNVLTLGGIAGSQDEEFKEKFNSKVPMQRMGNTNELGGALVFLLSSASSYMTGHNLILDGGFTKW